MKRLIFLLMFLPLISAQPFGYDSTIPAEYGFTVNTDPNVGFNNNTAQVNATNCWLTENGTVCTIGNLVSSSRGGLDNRYFVKNGTNLAAEIAFGIYSVWTTPLGGMRTPSTNAYILLTDALGQIDVATTGALNLAGGTGTFITTALLSQVSGRFAGMNNFTGNIETKNISIWDNITLTTASNINSLGTLNLRPWSSTTNGIYLQISNTSNILQLTGVGVSTIGLTDSVNFTEGGDRNITGLDTLEAQNYTVKREFKQHTIGLDTIYQNNRSREINVHLTIQASTTKRVTDIAYTNCYVGKPLFYNSTYLQSNFGIVLDDTGDDTFQQTITGDLDLVVPIGQFYVCNTTTNGTGSITLNSAWRYDL